MMQTLRPKTLGFFLHGPDLSQPLSFAIVAKQWCFKLYLFTGNPSAVSIDECIKVCRLFSSSID